MTTAHARSLIAAATLTLTAACGTVSAARPVGPAPADPPATPAAPIAHYLGPVTVTRLLDGNFRISPPARGAQARASWSSTLRALCAQSSCAGRSAPDIELADVTRPGSTAAHPAELHGQLMYVFTWRDNQCPPVLGPGTYPPPGHDCQATEFVDATSGSWVSTYYNGPVPSASPGGYRAPTATYTSATVVLRPGNATVTPRSGHPLVSWESVWRSFCPPDGSPTKSSQGGTCLSGSAGTVELATVTLHDTTAPAPKLMYVVTWTKGDCESLGGGAGQTRAPAPQPHPCTLRSYVDARTGHDEYDEDVQ